MDLPTVFHVTHWKAGSQWIRAVMIEALGDRVIPTEYWQKQVFEKTIVPGAVYAPVYAAAGQLRPILPSGLDTRIFVVVRDLRDTLVSWYYSLLYSHGDDWDGVTEKRKLLKEMNVVDGMAMIMRDDLYDAVSIQMSWLQDGAKIFKYEDLLRNELGGFRDIFQHCDIEISEERLRQVVQKHSFERVSGRKRGQSDPQSHLRTGEPGDWKNHFPPRLTTLFRTLFGDATIRMGYADYGPWQ